MNKKLSLQEELNEWADDRIVIGIDEVGRGPLAGPLTVCAVCLRPVSGKTIAFIRQCGIRDSKQLTGLKRRQLFPVIEKLSFSYSIYHSDVEYINRYGIVKAFHQGVRNCVKDIRGKLSSVQKITVLIDGFNVPLSGPNIKQQAIIKGDGNIISIAAASILAKVSRDRLMKKLSLEYPPYKWDSNKGYGTRDHIHAIRRYGKTSLHRSLFIRNILPQG